MTTLKAFVYDDNDRTLKDFVARARLGAQSSSIRVEVKSIDKKDFHDGMAVLQDRQKRARKGSPISFDSPSTIFDSADLLIVDYELSESDDRGLLLTGEVVSFFARTYSKCGIILSLNQVAQPTFDLTLRCNTSLWADLMINDAELEDPGLWSTGRWRSYRPWSWPVLPCLATQFQRMVKDAETHLDAKLETFFGVPDGIFQTLPREMADFVGSPQKATFASVAATRLPPKDSDLPTRLAARVAAATVYRWFDQIIIPGQNVLADAPHLIGRFPSLLKGDARKKGSWNASSKLHEWESLGIKSEVIRGQEFSKRYWLSRAAWWSELVSNNRRIGEVKSPWDSNKSPFVFAEDTSRFDSPENCKTFVAGISTPFVRRFVQRPPGSHVRYEPAVRFAIA